MKKTLTVNLGGTIYNIDEDAYALLDSYLNNLRYHFRKNPEGEEIVRDMEVRIAELFDERADGRNCVVTLENVEAVIARMGKPEELNDAEDEAADAETDNGRKAVRRLFRNPDDKVLGGVVSGVAAYFKLDVVPLRLLLLVAGCFFQWLLLVYLAAWIIVPLARTATEKLQMRGEPVNMENIGRTVTGGFGRKDGGSGERSVWRKVGDVIVRVIGLVLKLCLVLLVVCLLPGLLVALVVVFSLFLAAVGVLASVPALLYDLSPVFDWNAVSSFPLAAGFLSVCGLLVAGIPIVGLVQAIMQAFGNWKPMSTSVKVVLVLLWLVALVAGIVVLVQSPFADSAIPFVDNVML